MSHEKGLRVIIISMNFKAICGKHGMFNISNNNLTGNITGLFENCPKVKYVDFSFNRFTVTGILWGGIEQGRI